jgi:hypothetical protein
MNKLASILSLTALLLGASALPVPAYNREFVTGEDWAERMSPNEKYIALIPPSLSFAEYDVHLRLSLPQYILLIDQVMERNPRLQDEEVANIFASTIYIFEPENRPKLKEMEESFLKGDYEPEHLRAPRLLIDDLGELLPG